MMGISLWKRDQIETGVSLMYLGDAVVLETNNVGETKPHYFETKAESITFIVTQAYALLNLGYEVYA